MIKKLIGSNFRSHENLTMEFHPGVNVIWGLGGSGKTNIIRMIDWVMTNKPKYENVHSHFTTDPETSVTLILDNGTITLTKTPKKNEYTIDNVDSYSYTGATVPIPIAQKLNLTEININKQLDPHFLITATPGDVGRTINRITKIEKMDEWISSLTTLSNKTKWGLDSLKQEVVTLEIEIKFYDGIEQLEKEIDLHQQLASMIENVHEDIQYIMRTISTLTKLRERIDTLKQMDIESHIEQFEKLSRSLDVKTEAYNTLQSKVRKYNSVLLKKQKLEEINKDINFDELQNLSVLIKNNRDSQVVLKNFIHAYEQESYLKNQLEIKKSNYISAIKEFGICPICQNKISSKHIAELEETL